MDLSRRYHSAMLRPCFGSRAARTPSSRSIATPPAGVDHDTCCSTASASLDEALAAGIRVRHVMIAADALEHPDVAHALERLRRTAAVVTTGAAAVMAAVSPVQSSSAMVALAARPQPASVYAQHRLARRHRLRRAEPRQPRRNHPRGRSRGRDRRDSGWAVCRPLRLESASRIDGQRVAPAGRRVRLGARRHG